MKVTDCIWEVMNIGRQTIEISFDVDEVLNPGILKDIVNFIITGIGSFCFKISIKIIGVKTFNNCGGNRADVLIILGTELP